MPEQGAQLECLHFYLCVPGTIKVHSNGQVYRGENGSNECSEYDDACCVPDDDRLERYLASRNASQMLAKQHAKPKAGAKPGA